MVIQLPCIKYSRSTSTHQRRHIRELRGARALAVSLSHATWAEVNCIVDRKTSNLAKFSARNASPLLYSRGSEFGISDIQERSSTPRIISEDVVSLSRSWRPLLNSTQLAWQVTATFNASSQIPCTALACYLPWPPARRLGITCAAHFPDLQTLGQHSGRWLVKASKTPHDRPVYICCC